PAGAPELTVGELATRIWRGAGLEGEPHVELLGIRRGETLGEVLVGPGERVAAEAYPGIMEIESDLSTAAASWVAERSGADGSREAARGGGRAGRDGPGLIGPACRHRPTSRRSRLAKLVGVREEASVTQRDGDQA